MNVDEKHPPDIVFKLLLQSLGMKGYPQGHNLLIRIKRGNSPSVHSNQISRLCLSESKNVLLSNWEKPEDYLRAFIKEDDNKFSIKLFYELLKRDANFEFVTTLWRILTSLDCEEMCKEGQSSSQDLHSVKAGSLDNVKRLLKQNPNLKHRAGKLGLLSITKHMCPNSENKTGSIKFLEEVKLYETTNLLEQSSSINTLSNA